MAPPRDPVPPWEQPDRTFASGPAGRRAGPSVGDREPRTAERRAVLLMTWIAALLSAAVALLAAARLVIALMPFRYAGLLSMLPALWPSPMLALAVSTLMLIAVTVVTSTWRYVAPGGFMLSTAGMTCVPLLLLMMFAGASGQLVLERVIGVEGRAGTVLWVTGILAVVPLLRAVGAALLRPAPARRSVVGSAHAAGVHETPGAMLQSEDAVPSTGDLQADTAPPESHDHAAPALSPLDRLAVLVGALAWLLVAGAAVLACWEAFHAFRYGFSGFLAHQSGRSALVRALYGGAPFAIMVLVPRWSRILLSVSGAVWFPAASAALTVIAIIGTLASIPLLALAFDGIGEASSRFGMLGALVQGTLLGMLVWTLLAPFTHMVGVDPRYEAKPRESTSCPRHAGEAGSGRARDAATALVIGDLLRAACLAPLVMLSFWTVATGLREGMRFEYSGIVASGADPWMAALLVVQILLTVLIRRRLSPRIPPQYGAMVSMMLAITAGFIMIFDLVLTWRLGLFHVVAVLPVLRALPSLLREARKSD